MIFFGLTVHPNLKSATEMPAMLSLTNAALVPGGHDDPSTLYISVDGCDKLPLCTMSPSTSLQFHLDLVLEAGARVVFSVIGVNPISIVGYYHPDSTNEEDDEEVDDSAAQQQDDSDDEEDDSEDEVPPPQKPVTSPKQQQKQKSDPSSNGAQQQQPESKKRKLETPAPSTKTSHTLKGGLVVTDLTPHDPSKPVVKLGQRVAMRYIGRLVKGRKVFDSNTKGQPFSFHIGRGEVIKGWDLGIVGMNQGQKRTLMIPAKLAYGARGAMPDIPPNADLEFEVKVLSMK